MLYKMFRPKWWLIFSLLAKRLHTICFLNVINVQYPASFPVQKISIKCTLQSLLCHFAGDLATPVYLEVKTTARMRSVRNFSCYINYIFSPDYIFSPFLLFHFSFLFHASSCGLLYFFPLLQHLLLISCPFQSSFQTWVREAFKPKLPSFLKENLGLSGH